MFWLEPSVNYCSDSNCKFIFYNANKALLKEIVKGELHAVEAEILAEDLIS